MAQDPAKLLNLLNQTALQQRDIQTYQVLKEMIGHLTSITKTTTGSSGSGGGSAGPQGPKGDKGDKGDIGPPGRISDDPVIRFLMLNQGSGSSPSAFVNWSVLTNGNVTNPELIYAGGDVIMVHVP